MSKTITLRPIKETTEDYEKVEAKILELFRKEIYLPLLKQLNLGKTIQNAKWDDTDKALLEALRTGQVTYCRGTFSGRFNASISKELKRLGAEWDRRQGVFKVPQSSLPMDVRNAIASGEAKFLAKLAGIDQTLSKMLPEEIAGKIKVAKIFDTTLWKTDREFHQTIKDITVAPQLSSEDRARIADEWQNNLKLYIKDFTEKEILKLRKDVQDSVFTGNRYEGMFKKIQASYGVSANKAKFLARQETGLLMAKFKETRYEAAGVKEYKWGCVAGSKNHPVRHSHKILEGKTFRWDNPPITSAVGEATRRNNPGQDYNCRCFALPIVRFK